MMLLWYSFKDCYEASPRRVIIVHWARSYGDIKVELAVSADAFVVTMVS